MYLVGRFACVEFEVCTTAHVRECWKAPHRNNRSRWSEFLTNLAKYFRNKVMSIHSGQSMNIFKSDSLGVHFAKYYLNKTKSFGAG
jgi:hypothetical protein